MDSSIKVEIKSEDKVLSNVEDGNTEEAISYLLPNISSATDEQSLTNVVGITSSRSPSTLLSSSNVVTALLEHENLQTAEGTDAYIETLTDQLDEGHNVAVQLEDGTTAFIRATHKDGFQAVHLQDGTTAYISHALDLEEFASGVLDTVHNVEINSIALTKEQTSSNVIRGDGSRVTKTVSLGEKAFRCNFEGCDRFYSSQHHLKVHERTHTGDRPFKCNSCKKAFATGYSLKSHTRVHTGEKPYKCAEYCGKAFKTSGDLQKHLRTHTGERPFKCPYHGCERAFTTSNIRKVHMRIHTGERPYICPVEGCDRTFASATNYKNHIRIHTGEKPYVCVVKGCGKKFTEYSSLYKHNVVHTPTKPYVCDMCDRNYRQISTLTMHRRSAHGVTETSDVGEGLHEEVHEIGEQLETEDNNQSQGEECQRIEVMVVNSNGDAEALDVVKSETEIEHEVQLQLTSNESSSDITDSTFPTI